MKTVRGVVVALAVLMVQTFTTGCAQLLQIQAGLRKDDLADLQGRYNAQAEAWRILKDRDEMTGEISTYAVSPRTTPTSPHSDYDDLESWMVVGCRVSKVQFMYFDFTEKPILRRTYYPSGYANEARIRWNNEIKSILLDQVSGESALYYSKTAPISLFSPIYIGGAIKRTAESESVMLELPWYGESLIHFEYSTNGAAKAIAEVLQPCAR